MSRYLYRRPSGYYFRYVVPEALQERLQGREIRLSLLTNQSRPAKARAATLHARCLTLSTSGVATMAEAKKHILEGVTLTFSADPMDHPITGQHSLLRGILTELQNRPVVGPQSQPAVPTAPVSNLLSVEITKYIREMTLGGKDARWTDDTRANTQYVLDTFVEIVGDKPVLDVDKDDYLTFTETLQQLPSNRQKKKLTQGKPVDEVIAIAKRNKMKTLSKGTIKQMMKILRLFVMWLQEGDYPLMNRGIKRMKSTKQTTDDDGRDEFSPQQVKLIFESNEAIEFLGNCSFHWQRWLPSILALTGARIGEITQLMLNDVIEEHGVWCFRLRFDEDSDQRLKNENSERTIPIHPLLIEWGFLNFVAMMRKRPARVTNGRLWDLHGKTRLARRKAASAWGNRLIDKFVGDDRKLVFQSFRHNVCTMLNVLKFGTLQEWQVNRYVGHAGKGLPENQSTYFHAPILGLVETCTHVKYAIDWTAYRSVLTLK